MFTFLCVIHTGVVMSYVRQNGCVALLDSRMSGTRAVAGVYSSVGGCNAPIHSLCCVDTKAFSSPTTPTQGQEVVFATTGVGVHCLSPVQVLYLPLYADAV